MLTSFYLYPQNILFFLIAFLNLIIGFYLFGRHKFGQNRHFLPIFFFIFIWCFGIGMRSSIIGIEQKLFWTNFAYIGIVFTPMFFLLAVRSLYGYSKLLTSQWVALFLVSIALLILIFTDSYHHLFWIEFPTTVNEYNYLRYSGGLLYWLNASYQFLVAIAIGVLLVKARKDPLYRASSKVFLYSIIPPIFTNLLLTLGITFIPDYNIAPIGFIFTGPVMVYGFRNLRLFDLPTIGINQYLKRMQQGIIIANAEGVIQMINPFAKKILELNVGHRLSESPTIDGALKSEMDTTGYLAAHHFETFFHDEFYYIDLRATEIKNSKGLRIGILVVLKNITEEKKIANVVKVSQVNKIKSEERERLAKELQDRIAQGLYALMMLTKSAQNHALDGILGRTYDDLDDLLSQTQQLVKNVNLLYYELDDESFGKIGLIQALQDQIQIQKYQSNISIDLVNFDKIQLSTQSQRTIYGIIVGVLNEILKLSKPVSIVINISESSKNFMIKFIVYERSLQPGLLTIERVEEKFIELLETIQNINGVFEFSVINEEQKLINIQLPRK